MVAAPKICQPPADPTWEMVFASEKPGLLRLISRRLGETDGAEDILQEVALAAQTSSNRPAESQELARWLRAVQQRSRRTLTRLGNPLPPATRSPSVRYEMTRTFGSQ